ncbi:MAG: ABC transporter ATP-binding protein [Polaribacter sp.]|jgi:iron complex transport system ATP-binding protein
MDKNQNNIVLKTENLSIGYVNRKKKTIVAKDINLNLKEKNLITVLGKNGIGKSTFLRTIAKVQNALSGSIFINQKNLESYTNRNISTLLSLVLTERLPESQLTVFELVALGRQPYTNWIDKLSDNDVEKINIALQQTEIEHLQHKFFYELSDGQLQRVLIARALAQDTAIIILDEPTAHLDIHHTLKIFALLKKLVQKTSKTIIISTHQVNLALQFSDNVILFKDNKVISGSIDELNNINALEDLFPDTIINYDTKLKQFVIKAN